MEYYNEAALCSADVILLPRPLKRDWEEGKVGTKIGMVGRGKDDYCTCVE